MEILAEFEKALHLCIGLPYLHQGSNRHGVDCIGLVVYAAELIGVDLRSFDVPTRSYMPNGLQLVRGLKAACGDPHLCWDMGNVVVFRTYGTGSQHLACCGGSGDSKWIIHADRAMGVVEKSPYFPDLVNCPIYGIFTLPLGQS